MSASDQEPAPPGFRGIAIRPDPETVRTAPPFVNHVRVAGRGDALVLCFYYLDESRLGAAIGCKGAADAQMEMVDGVLHVEAQPVVRVSMPLTAVADLVAVLVQNVTGNASLVERALQDFHRAAELRRAAEPPAPEPPDWPEPGGSGVAN